MGAQLFNDHHWIVSLEHEPIQGPKKYFSKEMSFDELFSFFRVESNAHFIVQYVHTHGVWIASDLLLLVIWLSPWHWNTTSPRPPSERMGSDALISTIINGVQSIIYMWWSQYEVSEELMHHSMSSLSRINKSTVLWWVGWRLLLLFLIGPIMTAAKPLPLAFSSTWIGCNALLCRLSLFPPCCCLRRFCWISQPTFFFLR